MRSKSKEQYTPRLDFGSNLDAEGVQTGTIKELLTEINEELTPASGAEINFVSLGVTLNFVQYFTGREYTSITEPLPLSHLKTIKLLYLTNESSNMQLYEYLKAPHLGAKPTMEFRLTGVASRNEHRVKVVQTLAERLRTEISSCRLRHIEESLLTASKLLECIEIENRQILDPIYNTQSDDVALARSLGHLTEDILRYPIEPRTSTTPLDEAVYTYLRILPFLHFVGEYKQVVDKAKLKDTAAPISSEIEALGIRLGATHGEHIDADTPVTSITEFPAFIQSHLPDLIKLVKTATGLPTQRRDLERKLNYASKILNMYVFHEKGKTPLNVKTLSLSDCIAALCTIRYQQEFKTNYSPYWKGQTSADIRTNVFSQMEQERSIEELYEDDYIPHGISQLHYSRFCQFHAQFTGQQETYENILAFQTARLDKYSECLLLNDINLINAAVNQFNCYCQRQARLLTHPAFQSPFIERINSWLSTEAD